MTVRTLRNLLSVLILVVAIVPVAAAADLAAPADEPTAPPVTDVVTPDPATPPTTVVAPPTTEAPPPVIEPALPPVADPPTDDVEAPSTPANPASPDPAPDPETVGTVPLKAPHSGVAWNSGEFPYDDPADCADVDVPAGQIAWHFVLGPLDGATNAGTTLNSPSWGISGLHPEDTVGGGLQGANADWFVFNSQTTSPTDMTATTDGVLGNTELRISHTCSGSAVETGYLVITKVEEGRHAPDTPGTYTIAWDGPGDADGQVDVTAGTPEVVGPLPLGDYTLSEVSPPADVTTTITPNPVTVTAGDAASAVQVTVTNEFHGGGQHGFLRIEKVETGPLAPTTPGTYTIAWDGPGDADGQVEVTAGTPEVVGPLPLGDYTLTEVDPPAGSTTTITPNPLSLTRPGRNWALLVTVTNDFPEPEPETGYLEIRKVVTGDDAPAVPGTFTVAWDGPGDADGQVEVTAGTSEVVGPLPLGEYTVTEVDPPPGITPQISPNPVEVVAGDAATAVLVTVTNSYPSVGPGIIVDPPDDDADVAPATDEGPLPRTGATTLPLLLAGVALLVVGVLLTGGRWLLEQRTR